MKDLLGHSEIRGFPPNGTIPGWVEAKNGGDLELAWGGHFILSKIIVGQGGKRLSVHWPHDQPALHWLMSFPPNKNLGLLKIIMLQLP